MLADTATTHTYLDEAITVYCDMLTPLFETYVKVANGNIMSPTSQIIINLSPHLLKDVQHGYIFNNLATESLILIG